MDRTRALLHVARGGEIIVTELACQEIRRNLAVLGEPFLRSRGNFLLKCMYAGAVTPWVVRYISVTDVSLGFRCWSPRNHRGLLSIHSQDSIEGIITIAAWALSKVASQAGSTSRYLSVSSFVQQLRATGSAPGSTGLYGISVRPLSRSFKGSIAGQCHCGSHWHTTVGHVDPVTLRFI